MILAGGQGTRLHPLTLHHAKPAVTYGGRYRLIDIPISNSLNSGFRQIFVIAQYLSGRAATPHQPDLPVGPFSLRLHRRPHPAGERTRGEEEWFQGTADAVRKNLPTLLRSSADFFLILSGDQLYNINFQGMISFAESKGADLTIAAIGVPRRSALGWAF